MEPVERTERAHIRPRKRSLVEFFDQGRADTYNFRVLLPNGLSTDLILHNTGKEILADEFIEAVRIEFERSAKRTLGNRRKILWDQGVYLEDMSGNRITKGIRLSSVDRNKLHMLRLYDEAEGTIDTFKNMWDLTPDTDLLLELPAEYTFETALADLIDNSLQAVWCNGVGEKKMVSVTVNDHLTSIFDTGPGMDGTKEKSIVKWGKFGSSNHRSSRRLAIGGKPPYLTLWGSLGRFIHRMADGEGDSLPWFVPDLPVFGMFGYGGPIASMHLGRRAIVSSKTKESKKVFTLYLEREALLNSSGSECIWRTDGGIRDPSEEEIKTSPRGSFTKVEIYEPKLRCLEEFHLQCRLKDIYFPYIQCDELLSTGQTATPIEFQVNGVDLAEIEGGEVAITNLHSCNGPDFILQLHLCINRDLSASEKTGSRAFREANARLKCVYFPIIEGKECIDRILEQLEAEGYKISESFDSFCRVSVRRLGRLLPDARWGRLPFMEPKRKADKSLLKRCCCRVKCFVETDAGFSPTPSKTDLAHHDSFTTALKNFGNKSPSKESDMVVKIQKCGRPLSLMQLEKEYQDWVIQMHEQYDQEMDCGEDQPVIVVNPCNKKELGISSDVVRVHRSIRRKDASWESGQKIKILKGAAGCYKNNIYATLEYFLVDGFQGDVGGEARLICRPIDCPDEQGCILAVDSENANLEIGKSFSFPISVIDSGKCQAVDAATWKDQLEKRHQKEPSTIDVLNSHQCQQLDIRGALPVGSSVSAGFATPIEIAAVIRPFSFILSNSDKDLDQKYIIKENLEMLLEMKYSDVRNNKEELKPFYSERVKPACRKGLNGLYIFPLGCKFPRIFHKAGLIRFRFSVCMNSSCRALELQIIVKPGAPSKWGVFHDEKGQFSDGKPLIIRVGSYVPHLSIGCFDEYYNRIPFDSIPKLEVKILSEGSMLVNVKEMMADLSISKMSLQITGILIEAGNLDMIRPHYKATMEICSGDDLFSVSVPCQVIPGHPWHVKMTESPNWEDSLIPGHVINRLRLELFDAYNNHAAKGEEVRINTEGLSSQGCSSWTCKVNDHGFVNLGGLLRVTGCYGGTANLSVWFGARSLFRKEYQIAKRELKMVSKVPRHCVAGSPLENIVFEVFDPSGRIDEGIHDDTRCGQFHTLTLTSTSSGFNNAVRYNFQHGKCIVPCIRAPFEEGEFQFLASHSHHSELQTSIKVFVIKGPKPEPVTFSNPGPVEALLASLYEDGKKLYNLVDDAGLRVGSLEKKLEGLKDKKTSFGKEIYNLKASVEYKSLRQFGHLADAKRVIGSTEREGNDIAAAFCSQLKKIQVEMPEKQYLQDIMGVVALLGTVNDSNLSRMFSEYLGEDYMLAVVCKSYKASIAFGKQSAKEKTNDKCSLYDAASALRKAINGRFLVICLEEIRPYHGQIESDDFQRKLALPKPRLPSGMVPQGFLGYAVNMINVETDHLQVTTAAGHGLRETLFYFLFGELQVYETKADMQGAAACIQSGAISLDGGIKRRYGVIALGDWDLRIRFPVVNPKAQTSFTSQRTLDIFRMTAEKEAEMEALSQEITNETRAHEKACSKFKKRKDHLQKFIDNRLPLIKGVEEWLQSLQTNSLAKT